MSRESRDKTSQHQLPTTPSSDWHVQVRRGTKRDRSGISRPRSTPAPPQLSTCWNIATRASGTYVTKVLLPPTTTCLDCRHVMWNGENVRHPQQHNNNITRIQMPPLSLPASTDTHLPCRRTTHCDGPPPCWTESSLDRLIIRLPQDYATL